MQLTEALEWRGDHFLLAGCKFVLQHQAVAETATDGFHFYKNRSQLEQYERFLSTLEHAPRRVLELGIWDGGSAAFWVEALGLEKYAAIDIRNKEDSEYFTAWLRRRGRDRLKMYWGVDQTDAQSLQRVIAERGLQPLDLIIDDCSHMRKPTMRSFEILFPVLPAGAHYVIEDWAWALQPEFQAARHPWGHLPSLHPVVDRLVRLHGSRPDLIDQMMVFPDLIALRRGPGTCPAGWTVNSSISRRSRPWGRIARRVISGGVGRLSSGRRRR